MESIFAPPMKVRLRFTHALMESFAQASNTRILHIKGVALHSSLAAGRHSSSDADILVDPSRVLPFVQHMVDHGWQRRSHFESGSVFEHAAAYYHPVWGTVDVHRSWPGLDADPCATFDAWYEESTRMSMAGHDVKVPSLLDQRLLLLLHAARDPQGRTSHDFNKAWAEVPDGERADIEQRAAELGGSVPLMILTDEGDGRRRALVENAEGFHLWEAMGRGANPTEVWTALVRDAHGPAAKARIVMSALRVNRDHLAVRLGHEPSPQEIRTEWRERLGRGVRRLATLASRRHQRP